MKKIAILISILSALTIQGNVIADAAIVENSAKTLNTNVVRSNETYQGIVNKGEPVLLSSVQLYNADGSATKNQLGRLPKGTVVTVLDGARTYNSTPRPTLKFYHVELMIGGTLTRGYVVSSYIDLI